MLAALLASSALGSEWIFSNYNVHPYQFILSGPFSLRWFPTGDCVRQRMFVVNVVFPLSHQASEPLLPEVLSPWVVLEGL